jgi:1-acyl-sn-glycerol-3-phosphate acyltransferase
MIFYVSILTLVGLYVVQKIAIVRRIHGLQFIVRLPLLIFCFSLGSVMGISCSLYCKLLIPAGSTGKSVDVNQFTGEVFYFLVKHILNIQCRIISSPSHSTLRRAGSPSRAGSSIAITDGSLSSDSSFCNINKKEEVQKMISARVPCVLICNHQSSMDLFCMAFLWPRRLAVIAKESVQYYPLIGWHLKMANNIFIKRSNREKAIETMNEAARKMLEQKVTSIPIS